MQRWPIATGLSIGLCIAILLSVPAAATTNSYTENFTTTTYMDPVNTTCDWDTVAGELRHKPFPLLTVGSFDTPGNTLCTFVSGDHLYVADMSAGLLIIDITDPTVPAFAGTYDTPGSAWRVVVEGNYAYVADLGSGLQVIDVSDATSPSLAGSYNTPGAAYDVVVAGNHAYVADFTSGLAIVNISDPTSPTLAGSYDTPGNAFAVFVAGDHAYVGDDASGLQVIDISDPTAPTLAGTYSTPGNARNLCVDGDHALVACYNGGLQIIDISDPTVPTLAGSYLTQSSVRDVVVSGDWAYLADYQDGLTVVDIRDPTTPVLYGSLDTPGTARGMFVSGNRAYVADYDAGIQVADISRIIPPRPVDTISPSGSVQGVFVSGDHAYVAATTTGLVVIDITDPTALVSAGWYNTPGIAYGAFVSGDNAFVADGSFGLHVIDVTDPTAPTLAGTIGTPGTSRNVVVEGDTAYVADTNYGLRVIDVSDPTSPTMEGTYITAGDAYDVAVSGDYAYVAASDAGLVVVDISDPTTPAFAGVYDTPGSCRGVAVAGDHAYVTDYLATTGFLVIDISDPTTPTFAGGENLLGNTATDVFVSGDFAWALDLGGGVHLVHIADPSNPSTSTIYNPSGQLNGVFVRGDYAWVAAGGEGLIAMWARLREVSVPDNDAFSKKINTSGADIVAVSVTTAQQDSTDWYLSGDGGFSWDNILPGSGPQWLTTPGNDLRWAGILHWMYDRPEPIVSSLSISWLLEGPVIESVTDIGNDQGRQVRLTWTRSGFDDAGSATPITSYAIFRKIDPVLAATETPLPELIGPTDPAALLPPGGWDLIATWPAFAEPTYSVVVPTLGDSTISAGQYETTFLVRAATATPAVYWDSAPDSGYSVDNLSPMVPQGVAAAYNTGSGNQLAWDPPVDQDFDYFRVYRGLTPDFLHDPRNLVGATVTAAWTDPAYDGGGVFYKITAVDFSGNESPPASPLTATGIGTPKPPVDNALYQNIPNPFNPSTTIRYALRAPSDVSLTVFDAAGRRVRTLVDTPMPAGAHDVAWDGVDARGQRVASGVYFYRITAGAFTQTRKMVMLK